LGHHWNDVAARQEQYNDLLRQAERERLIWAAAHARKAPRLYGPALEWLGCWLIAWGWRLRARYGAIEFQRRPKHRCEQAT